MHMHCEKITTVTLINITYTGLSFVIGDRGGDRQKPFKPITSQGYKEKKFIKKKKQTVKLGVRVVRRD